MSRGPGPNSRRGPSSGAWGEHTLRWNVEAWERLRIRHRALVDVSRRELAVAVCGAKASFPLFAAPTALHKLAHPEGEVATAKACAAAGVPMILSSLSSTAVEEVCAAVDPAARTVLRAGQPVVLGAKEFALLLVLLRASGQVVTRQRLEEAVYGFDDALESNALEVHMHHLRRKLGEELIHTVRGVGYYVGAPRAGA